MASRFKSQSGDDLFYSDEDDLDEIKSLLAYILMKNTELDSERIYSYIFGEGKRILWH